ncbi:MAG: DNA methyltransferase, partial [Myxococcales bacterium]
RPVPPAQRIHTTEKPVDLLQYLVEKSTAPGDLVVDPFMGSGSLLEAALRTGRRAVGVELDEEYCEAAAERLEDCGARAA